MVRTICFHIHTQKESSKMVLFFHDHHHNIVSILKICKFQESNNTTIDYSTTSIISFSQLKWQQREIIMFFHFGVNTFTDSEWGTGHESPSVFNPVGLDTDQWISTAAEAGVSLVILTAKHHDGFCLWPSKYTDHSVAFSTWMNGKGDVVQELVNSARSHGGIDVGLYLSPWDRHDKRYAHDLEYNEFYLAQLQELFNKYGSVREIWFDGAKGSNAPNMTYYFSDWFSMVKELQSSINIFSDAGPDVRWVGNEMRFAGTTCWSTVNGSSLSIGNASIVEIANLLSSKILKERGEKHELDGDPIDLIKTLMKQVDTENSFVSASDLKMIDEKDEESAAVEEENEVKLSQDETLVAAEMKHDEYNNSSSVRVKEEERDQDINPASPGNGETQSLESIVMDIASLYSNEKGSILKKEIALSPPSITESMSLSYYDAREEVESPSIDDQEENETSSHRTLWGGISETESQQCNEDRQRPEYHSMKVVPEGVNSDSLFTAKETLSLSATEETGTLVLLGKDPVPVNLNLLVLDKGVVSYLEFTEQFPTQFQDLPLNEQRIFVLPFKDGSSPGQGGLPGPIKTTGFDLV